MGELVIIVAYLYVAIGPILGVEALRRLVVCRLRQNFQFSLRFLLELTTAAAVLLASARFWDGRALLLSIPAVYVLILLRRTLLPPANALCCLLILAVIPVALPYDQGRINFLLWPLLIATIYTALAGIVAFRNLGHRKETI